MIATTTITIYQTVTAEASCSTAFDTGATVTSTAFEGSMTEGSDSGFAMNSTATTMAEDGYETQGMDDGSSGSANATVTASADMGMITSTATNGSDVMSGSSDGNQTSSTFNIEAWYSSVFFRSSSASKTASGSVGPSATSFVSRVRFARD
jgi:hypothetical protein